jgi:multidrug resistance efflux pump
MIELFLCSLVSILPDYLYRRYRQGKRIGHEITLYSVWYELRWGITACVMLTVTLITVIFYYHPATKHATAMFRTVPILPEAPGRVAEVYVGVREEVKAGQKLFRLDSTAQAAAVETATRQVAEVDAATLVATTELAAADGKIYEAEQAYRQSKVEYDTKLSLQRANPGAVAAREVERLEVNVQQRQGSVDAARANKKTIEEKIASQLPAQKQSAEAALKQAEAELAKTVVYAGVDGQLEQFALRVGDIVNPFMRPAGILVPGDAGRGAIIAGFNQIESQVVRPGLVGEATCISKPMTIIPLIVTRVQDAIAAGQLRPTDVLIDTSQTAKPGTLTVYMEPLYAGSLGGLPPGSSCIVNVYTNNHDRLEDPATGFFHGLVLHAIDATGLVHALILRIQAILLPVQTLVLGGH